MPRRSFYLDPNAKPDLSTGLVVARRVKPTVAVEWEVAFGSIQVRRGKQILGRFQNLDGFAEGKAFALPGGKGELVVRFQPRGLGLSDDGPDISVTLDGRPLVATASSLPAPPGDHAIVAGAMGLAHLWLARPMPNRGWEPTDGLVGWLAVLGSLYVVFTLPLWWRQRWALLVVAALMLADSGLAVWVSVSSGHGFTWLIIVFQARFAWEMWRQWRLSGAQRAPAGGLGADG